MAYSPIQFQQGMSLPEFLQSFGTEANCAEAVKCARWPDGPRCPRCGDSAHCVLGTDSHRLFQCNACRHQASLTAGTLFASTKLPLSKWFLAIYLISQAKTGLAALSLKRQIGVSYPTAWLMHQKIMTAMAARDAQHRLSGTVQVDDAYLGGERSGGKPGRGSENKIRFVAAVSLNDEGRPLYVKLTPVSGFSNQAISKWAKSSLAPGTDVLSDGLGCFAAVIDAHCAHTVIVVGQRKPRDLPQFKWVNTVLGNLKTMLSGAYKAFKYGKYADCYLGAFAYRFNRRFDLAALVPCLIVDVCRAKAKPERLIRHAEFAFQSGRRMRDQPSQRHSFDDRSSLLDAVEWFYRSIQEARRMFRRYLIEDMAFFGMLRESGCSHRDRTHRLWKQRLTVPCIGCVALNWQRQTTGWARD